MIRTLLLSAILALTAASAWCGSAAQEQLRGQYDDALKSLKEDDEGAQQRIAQWCDQNKLKAESEKHWGAFHNLVVKKKRAELEKKPARNGFTALISYCTANNLKSTADELTRELLLFDYREQKAKLKPDDVKALLALAKFCQKNTLPEQAEENLRAIIALQTDHAEARAELGYFKFEDKWQTLEDLGQKFVKLPAAERDTFFGALQKAGFKKSRADLDQYVRWSESPKGRHRNVKVPGYTQETAWYHLNVPEEYAPFKAPLPLVIFLHGGGVGAGSADQIVAYGDVLASGQGCLMLFPNHIHEWWAHPSEMKYFMTIMDQVLKNYRVDQTRIYLMGASMGGNGCWAISSQFYEMFAAASPATAYWAANLGLPMKNLAAKPVYIHHGTKDAVVPCECSRNAHEDLKKLGGNVVFKEIDAGHQLPPEEYEHALKWLRQYQNKTPFKMEDMLTRAKNIAGGTSKK